jgi:glycosyltransferase involved in cell wall biosynthesis
MTTRLRVAVTNWTDRLAGGAERYLQQVVPHLSASGGSEIALLHEQSEPTGHALILPDTSASWSVERLGKTEALRELRDWSPDVIFAHGMNDPELEEGVQAIAPSVLVAHSYHGMCVSGTKTWCFPVIRSCERILGPGCLAHYYPHRCGGLNPITMMRLYGEQERRKRMLARYAAVVTLSSHMRAELERAGVRATLIPVAAEGGDALAEERTLDPRAPWRLLFVGRFQHLKGGQLFLESLVRLRALTALPLDAILVGDGPQRDLWQKQAREITRKDNRVRIEFPGWLDGEGLEEQWRRADLFVFPSFWPEPLGLSGIDASRHGVPAVGFRLGAVPEWLEDGRNGHLAPGDPPTAAGLAEAILRALGDRQHYERLRASTRQKGLRAAFGEHAGALSRLFERVAARGGRESLAT